ncbi:MAG: hypothetical protein IH987_11135 [Planctomycetes bacterium]|nr:hypothetical protein [Planctomycetota bacterium]
MIARYKPATVLSIGLLTSVVWAGETTKSFTLSRFIPADSWMLYNAAPNPECEWICAKQAKIMDALWDSGIDRDVMGIILSVVPQEHLAATQATLDKFSALARAVRWADLFGGEVAFSERITDGLVPREIIFLARGSNNSNKSNAKAIAALMEELAGLMDKLAFSESKTEGARTWTLGISETDPHEGVPTFTLFLKNDILGMAFGSHPTDDVFALMEGKAGARAIVDRPRFKNAISEVKSAKDAISFYDIKTMMGQIPRLIKNHVYVTNRDGKDELEKVLEVVQSAVEMCNIVDYIITTVETEGVRQLTHTVTRVREDKINSPLAKAFFDRKAFDRFDQYIPAEAKSFSLSTTVDVGKLYGVLTSFIQQQVPGGEEVITKWNEMLAGFGLDPQRDIFDWLSGEIITVSMPPAFVSPMGGDDSVLMIRVKDSALAAAKVRATIEFLQQLASGAGQPLSITEADLATGGFTQISHPLAMFLRPVIGVHDEWLMVGTSAKAVDKCLKVAAGKAPSIKKNHRFMEEGLLPKGAVLSASFTDTSKFGQELGSMMGMASLLGGGLVAMIPDDNADAKKLKNAAQKTLSILMKLAPILQTIDYYSSESSVTTRSGNAILCERVVTYKKPKPKKETATAQVGPGSK